LMQEQLRLREIEVTVDLGPGDPWVVGNAIQMEQVFINLLTNARDAMADSRRKAIRISGSVGSAGTELAFADTGPGIPPGLERRIFDPFFTTKEVGKGTGLGLSIVTDIKMPGMDGFALLSEIRARRPDTPTLMITGHGEHALAIGALRGGAYDFIQKPIDRDYFVTSLRRAIEMSELGRQAKKQQL